MSQPLVLIFIQNARWNVLLGEFFLFWQYIMLPCHPNEPDVNTACSMGQGVVPK